MQLDVGLDKVVKKILIIEDLTIVFQAASQLINDYNLPWFECDNCDEIPIGKYYQVLHLLTKLGEARIFFRSAIS